MLHLQHEAWDGNFCFRRKAGQEQTIKLNKSDFKKYVQSKTEVSYCHGPLTFLLPIDKNSEKYTREFRLPKTSEE